MLNVRWLLVAPSLSGRAEAGWYILVTVAHAVRLLHLERGVCTTTILGLGSQWSNIIQNFLGWTIIFIYIFLGHRWSKELRTDTWKSTSTLGPSIVKITLIGKNTLFSVHLQAIWHWIFWGMAAEFQQFFEPELMSTRLFWKKLHTTNFKWKETLKKSFVWSYLVLAPKPFKWVLRASNDSLNIKNNGNYIIITTS